MPHRLLTAGLVKLVFAMTIAAQVQSGIRSAGPSPYITAGMLPLAAREYLHAFGDRIQNPGNERTTLTGTYTDAHGAVAATLTWEAPGKLRFDRGGTGMAALVFNTGGGAAVAAALAALSAADAELLESLLDDRPEAFLYGFGGGQTHRFLGARFRTDGGKTKSFAGPWYDIHEVLAPVKASGSSAAVRQKYFCFDSDTKLLARATYILQRGSGKSTISTEYSGWINHNGQAVPGQIVRRDNGTVVFTFKTGGVAIGPAVADATFTKP